MNRRLWMFVWLGALATLIALPIILQRDSSTRSRSQAQDQLILITPHNDAIRQEFGEAFARWWQQTRGRSVHLDWRTPGGSAEIRKVIDTQFQSFDAKARTDVGLDVFFGGGDFEFAAQHKLNRLAKIQAFERHPEWFTEQSLPRGFSGEPYWNAEQTWVAACLSQFGICYNRQTLARLALPEPSAWQDLGDPRYSGVLALADPTKSGSVARAFELVLQQQMQETLRSETALEREQALALGWKRGLNLIQQLSANARYFTDYATKVPQDVGQGDAAAGMCIDFFGRSFAEALKTADGSSRMDWHAPRGGTSVSGDPIAVFRGAPNAEVAQGFVEFVVSLEGQALWNSKVGSPHGPQQRALRRLPVRRDAYAAEWRKDFVDQENPYESAATFVYQPELTGKAFRTLRSLVKVLGMDSHAELQEAWQALRASSFPPQATALFYDIGPLSYELMGRGDPELDSPKPLIAHARVVELSQHFRDQYRRVALLAKREIANPSRPMIQDP